MSAPTYPEEYLEKAKRYYSQRPNINYVSNKLAELNIDEATIELIVKDIEQSVTIDTKSGARKKLLTGFLIFVGAAFVVSVASGYWFDIKVIGIAGIIAMIYGFIRMASGLKVILEIEDSAMFKQLSWFKFGKNAYEIKNGKLKKNKRR